MRKRGPGMRKPPESGRPENEAESPSVQIHFSGWVGLRDGIVKVHAQPIVHIHSQAAPEYVTAEEKNSRAESADSDKVRRIGGR